MPIYDVELDDGRIVTLDSDHEPGEDEIFQALGDQAGPAQPLQLSIPDGISNQFMSPATELPWLRSQPTDLPPPPQGPPLDTMSTLAMGGVGLQEGFHGLGETLWSLAQGANEPIAEFGPIALTPISFLPPIGFQLSSIARARAKESREIALEARKAKEQLVPLATELQEAGGAPIARTIGQAIPSVAPALASGPLGMAAPIVAGGFQAGGATLSEAQSVFEQQPEARRGTWLPNVEFWDAAAPAVLDAAQTAALTFVTGKLFGPGIEGATLSAKREAIKNSVGRRAKEVFGEALEEGAQQFVSDYVVGGMSYNPSITFEQAFDNAIQAGIAGGVVGAGVIGAVSTSERSAGAIDEAAINRALEQRAQPERTSDAVQPETTPVLPGVSQPQVQETSQVPVPVSESGAQAPEAREEITTEDSAIDQRRLQSRKRGDKSTLPFFRIPVPEGITLETILGTKGPMVDIGGRPTRMTEASVRTLATELRKNPKDFKAILEKWAKVDQNSQDKVYQTLQDIQTQGTPPTDEQIAQMTGSQFTREPLEEIGVNAELLGLSPEIGRESYRLYEASMARSLERSTKEQAKGGVERGLQEKGKEEEVLKPAGALEEQIPQAPTAPADVFEMDDAGLADILETQYGKRETGAEPLTAGRAGTYVFPTFDAFKTWMDMRYGERDIEGMRLAFAEADTATKIRYIKENKAADPHKKAWVANLATGAALPTADPPVARTTPRPGPTGAPITPAPPGAPPTAEPPPARPAEPPPPPRQPTHRRKFDIMALTQLFRQFAKSPVVNERLMRAYGRFVPGTQAVELKARLMWDTKLAERVLGHEIGHFLDLAIAQIGRGTQLAQRLRPLYDFRGRMWQAQDLKDEARRLSRAWRGPFQNGNRYRDSANELFADFMSAMFNSPEWVNQNFPTLFDAFQEVLDSKPQFKSAYREIETWLQGGTMAREFIQQQETSVTRTLEELEKPRTPSKASLIDRLHFATMSMWRRAFQKEGKPRELGTSIADDLEYSKTWAAKENAIMADDFIKSVDPHLRQVDDNPIKARAILTAYSQAVRTLGERRAAGVWIEQHPVEARAMLNHLLSLDPTLRSKWANDLNNAANNQLYDLSAAIFREIYDRGDKYVSRIMREIDALNLGVDGQAALMAFNVRGKLLNPGGLTAENSQAVIDELKDQLGPQKFTQLETAAKNLRDMMYRTQEKMHNEGLIADKTWTELIQPNQDNYVPYAVLDYFEGKVRAGVMPQKGTAKDIADVAAAVQLKIASANSWRQHQRQVQLVRDAYQAGGVTIPVGEEIKRASDIEKIRSQNKTDDTSRAVLWQDGKPHLVEFPADPGKMFEKAFDAPAFYEHIEWVGEASDITHRVMQLYTQFSVPFLFWRNPVRGARSTALKVGFLKTGQQLTPRQMAQNLRLARNYARAAFGHPMLPEVRDLVDRQILLPPRLSQSMVRDMASLRQMLEGNIILANQVRQAHVGRPAWWKGGDVGRQAVILSEKLFSTYEAFEKIYTYQAALQVGMTPAKAGAVARRAGIPKPGVGGKWSLAMEVWFPWTRVHLQGMRSTFDMLMDPSLGKPFASRFIVTEALPRMAKVAIATGIVAGAIKWAIKDDEDDEDGVMAEFLRRVSPYKMALDDTIPLYFYDPRTGKVHYLWEFKRGKEVPKHFEAVSLRIPASEEGRLWGILLYNMMTAAPGAYEKAGQPGKGFTESAGQWAVNYLGPGLSPIIETADNLKDMILLGRNPQDPYRGQPAANSMMFEAGGVDRAEAIAGYVMNQLGSPGELAGVMAANFGLLDERALNSMSRRLPTDYKAWTDKVPFIKTAVAHDNYGQYREEKISELEENQLRAKSRLLMPEQPRAIYDFYYKNLNRKDKLTDLESEQFEIAREFVTQVWGTLTIEGEPNPDSFYGKAAHAVGKDGSREAKETFKRDITSAAAPYIAAFAEVNRMSAIAPGTPQSP